MRELELGHALGGRPLGCARLAQPREVALVVGGEHGDPLLRELLGDQLQRPRLPGARRARDQPVTIHRLQRQLDDRLAGDVPIVNATPEVDRGALDDVALADRRGEVSHPDRCSLGHVSANGLTQDEAQRRLAERGPPRPPATSRSTASIVRANVITPFNAILAALGLLTLVFADWRDALFLAII